MGPKLVPEINTALCTGCDICVEACPMGALALVARKVTLVRPDLCKYDGVCELACPTGAIQAPFMILFGDDLT
jgi:NAD-dependent dihydropyrimidine dehydrogenase PreA subunit